MALVSCPDCGAQVSDSAVVCAQCGFPLRRDALDRAAGARPGGPGGSGRNTAGIIIGVAAAGVVVFVVLGILAALAIPRFTAAAGRAKEKEGEGLLKQAYTLENAYYANHGAYTADLEELKTVGWLDGPTLYYTVEVRLDGPTATLACLEARPKRGADVQPLSMDSLGVIYRGAGCTGEGSRSRTVDTSMVVSFDTSVFTPQESDDGPGEGGEAGARTMLRAIYVAMAEYRAEHGRDPTDLGPVLRNLGLTRAMTENTLTVDQSTGHVCVSALANSGGYELSVDRDGRLYRGSGCSGAVLEQFDTTTPADTTS